MPQFVAPQLMGRDSEKPFNVIGKLLAGSTGLCLYE